MLPLIFGQKPTPYAHATVGGIYSHGDSITNGVNGGHGNLTDRSSPLQIGSLTTWKAFGQSQSSSIAVKSDGTLWSWGYNSSGQLGNSTTGHHSSPEQIGALTNWGRQLGGGGAHHTSVKTDGTLWAWGYGGQGQLGQGNTLGKSSPVQIGGLTNWTQTCTSTKNHRSGGTSGGRIYGWGNNAGGQLGDGTTTARNSPSAIGSLTTWDHVELSQYGSMAIKTDGTLWGWGRGNYFGAHGLGNTNQYSSPVQVGSLTDWDTVAIGGSWFLAIKTDGTIWGAGANNNGRLGDGTTSVRSSPVQFGADSDWASISLSAQHCHCIKTNGTAWVAGTNAQGQHGLGTVGGNFSSPTQLGTEDGHVPQWGPDHRVGGGLGNNLTLFIRGTPGV